MPVKSGSAQLPSALLRFDEAADAAGRRFAIVLAGGDQAQHGPGRLRRRDVAGAAQARVFVACRTIRPNRRTACWQQSNQLAAGVDQRIVERHADGAQAGEHLPGAVDVVHAPAAEPAAVGLLRCAHVAHGLVDDRIADAIGRACRALRARGPSGRACSGRSSRCDRRTARSRGTRISLSRSNAPQPPSRFCIASIQLLGASQRLRRAIQADGRRFAFAPRSWQRTVGRPRALPAAASASDVGLNCAASAIDDHGRVVDVGIEIVGVLEAPAAGRGVDRLAPVAVLA